MPENKNNSKKNNGYKHQPKKTYEHNSRQSTQTPVNEFSSIGSQQAYSNYYFGLNNFDIIIFNISMKFINQETFRINS